MIGKKIRFVFNPDLKLYNYPPECPFNSQRAAMTREILQSMDLLSGDDFGEFKPEPASRAAMEDLHSSDYLDILEKAQEGQLGLSAIEVGLGTPDTPIFKGLYDYSALVAGASLAGADLLRTGQARIAFNPAGGLHHASSSLASGFCYVNDVALACSALTRGGKRVLYLDVDVHHGDGVQTAFYNRKDVLTVSIHQDGRTLFPGSGAVSELGSGEGQGYSVNLPLPPGTGDDLYLEVFREVVLPLAQSYAPDFIVMVMGMDCLAGDHLAGLKLSNNAYAEVLAAMIALGHPMLVTGGGGYNPRNTARAWALAWTIMTGTDTQDLGLPLGVGGVMLESTEWQAGLRDRPLVADPEEIIHTRQETAATVAVLKKTVFPLHGM